MRDVDDTFNVLSVICGQEPVTQCQETTISWYGFAETLECGGDDRTSGNPSQ
jgi:hypothetical protein